jgi:hypothetical protein
VLHSKTTASRQKTYNYTYYLLRRVALPISGQPSRRRRVGVGPVGRILGAEKEERRETGGGEKG